MYLVGIPFLGAMTLDFFFTTRAYTSIYVYDWHGIWCRCPDLRNRIIVGLIACSLGNNSSLRLQASVIN